MESMTSHNFTEIAYKNGYKAGYEKGLEDGQQNTVFNKVNCDIILYGCEYDTEISIDLNQDEIDLIERISELSIQNSKGEMSPTIEIRCNK